jgi:hypothetical protein
MFEVFIYETNQLLEQLEQIIIKSENSNFYSSNDIDEVLESCTQ